MAITCVSLAFILVSCLLGTAVAQSEKCNTTYDVVLVVDGSASIGISNFRTLQSAVVSFIQHTLEQNSNVQIGIVLYSKRVTSQVPLTSDVNTLVSAVRGFVYPASSTYTNLGIDQGLAVLLQDNRKHVPRVLVVITDGLSTKPSLTERAASKARAARIGIYCVGIDSAVQDDPFLRPQYRHELEIIASDHDHILHIDTFDTFLVEAEDIAAKFCRATANIVSGLQNLTVHVGDDFELFAMMSESKIAGGHWHFEDQGLEEGGRYDFSMSGLKQNMRVRSSTKADSGMYSYVLGDQTAYGWVNVIDHLNGGWSLWGDWKAVKCSVACGVNVIGEQERRRTCTNPKPSSNGKPCSGQDRQTQQARCNLKPCPGGFANGLHNLTVRAGENFRLEALLNSAGQAGSWRQNGTLLVNGGRTAISADGTRHVMSRGVAVLKDAGTYSLTVGGQTSTGYVTVIVDGKWGAWDHWKKTCAATCGGHVSATLRRTRKCDSPSASYGGDACEGPDTQTKKGTCQQPHCAGVDDGAWGHWGPWTKTCFSTCGGNISGSNVRERECNNPPPSNGGKPCKGYKRVFTKIHCNKPPCTGNTNGKWGHWGPWTKKCDAKCGLSVHGTGTRLRKCDSPAPTGSGKDCEGESNQTREIKCHFSECGAVDGMWGQWDQWNKTCHATCGGNVSATEKRTRHCDNPPPSHNGKHCEGDDSQSRNAFCITPLCIALNQDGGWGHWSDWRKTCSSTCGTGNVPGSAIRNRLCNSPPPKGTGATCKGSRADTRNTTCHVEPCPVGDRNGGWSTWNSWKRNCFATCGGNVSATLTRSRTCTQPEPSGSGRPCIGFGVQTLNDFCQTPQCTGNVDGGWGNWGFWNRTCSAACGGTNVPGKMTRVRQCSSPPPTGSGANCNGISLETRNITCNQPACNPVNGGWGAWGAWVNRTCSASCGDSVDGRESSSRKCDSPAPRHGGMPCSGSPTKSRSVKCTEKPKCTDVSRWGAWGQWRVESCLASCGGKVPGTARRDRRCIQGSAGTPCTGPSYEIRKTNCTMPVCDHEYGESLCHNVRNMSGIGYRYHPEDCDKYIQCYFYPNGTIVGVYRNCPFGYYWDATTLRCNYAWDVRCPMEKCSNSCTLTHPMDGSCRAYWSCQQNASEAMCCPIGFRYTPRGCQPDFYNCRDQCPLPCYGRGDKCELSPSWDGTDKYRLYVGQLGWVAADCPAGTRFDISECGCKEVNDPDCSPKMTLRFNSFEANNRELLEVVTFKDMVMEDGVGKFDRSAVRANISSAPPTPRKPTVLTFRYRLEEWKQPRQILASGSDCRDRESMVVSLYDDRIVVEVTSAFGTVTRMPLSTKGTRRVDWKDVVLVYNGKMLTGAVKTEKVKYINKAYAPNVNMLECGLVMGADVSRKYPYTGVMDNVSVYNCDPGDLF